ncbi:MAG: hypothetical protein JWM72_980 [Actinomycetia bacterium]|nr:hypothetical protein [Actinomycetes bacterium]
MRSEDPEVIAVGTAGPPDLPPLRSPTSAPSGIVMCAMASGVGRVAAVWRGDPATPVTESRNHSRLAPILDAIADVGIAVEPVAFSEGIADALAERLTVFDGVLVWVDPISGDGDRTVLDALLRNVASQGTWVSAHPDAILKMGTKEVLHRTRSLGWGADTHLYSTIDEFRTSFPAVLTAGEPRVLKQHRGNGGIGVWKVTSIDRHAGVVRVQHAAPRDDATEDMTLEAFIARCSPYFAAAGKLIDQPFAPRLAEGMIRAYFVERDMVGFARQQPANRTVDPNAPDPDRVLGMPAAKTMYPADDPEFQALRSLLEDEWLPGLQRLVDVADAELPVLWDADFLYGPRTDRGDDTYMLCEINVSSVIPFPEAVPAKLALAVKRRGGRA